MAKSKSGAKPPASPLPSASAPTPPAASSFPSPPGNLAKLITRTTWAATDIIHRIHPDRFAGDAFNPGHTGDARFSPIRDAAGDLIPTIYGGTTFDCAAMETVFHDVPFAPGLKSVQKGKLRGHQYSQVLATSNLMVADLTVTALRKVGITRSQLIETEKDHYPDTRAWAEAIHAQCPDIQGLRWISRQDDRAFAVVLFGDRVGAKPLVPQGSSLDIVDDPRTYADIVALADRIGVKLHGK